MKKNLILIGLLCFANSLSIFAQRSTFYDVEDARQRGYYDRPYLRYEAEEGLSTKGGSAAYLPQTFNQEEVQSEASNQQAVQLNSVGDYVQWTNTEAADGMTIRFSLPDNALGTGTKGTLKLYVNDEPVQDIALDSRWAWQYFFSGNSDYGDNTPSSSKVLRMRFDEVRVKLAEKIPANATFKLEKADNAGVPYTVDFVELEPIPARVEQPQGAIVYTGNGSDLRNFVNANQGAIIYIPEGKYDVPTRIRIAGDNTKLIGAGMWYTELHFTALPTGPFSDPSNPNGFNARGFDSDASNVEVSGFYLTTVNERRYSNYTDTGKGAGNGFGGTFGQNSKISDVWVTHFECGTWLSYSDGLHISNARFRNNYADGINLTRGAKNSVVEHCSFRNNCDDDMASWARTPETENITYRYNTSEHNMRGAGVGFFGGKQNKALNLLIVDPIEDGIRINNNYGGMPFSDEGYFELRHISIYRAGQKANGSTGRTGDLWGNRTAGIFITSGGAGMYDVKNFIFSDIDIYSSKGNAIMLLPSSANAISNVLMEDVTIDQAAISTFGNDWAYYGFFMEGSNGSNNLFCLNFQNMGAIPETSVIPAYGFTVSTDCAENLVSLRVGQTIDLNDFVQGDFAGDRVFSLVSGADMISLDAEGRITGLNEGDAQVKVTDSANPANTVTFNVIVKEVAVTDILISNETLCLVKGESYRLSATIVPASATNTLYSWTGSNTDLARVSATGLVSAKLAGNLTVTLKSADGGFTKTCAVTIVEDPSLCTNDVFTPESNGVSVIAYGNAIQVSNYVDGEVVSVYNLAGAKVYSKQLSGKGGIETIYGLPEGIYTVATEKAPVARKVVVTK